MRQEPGVRQEGNIPYSQERAFDVALAGQQLKLISRAGFPEWGHISQATQLLASHAEIESCARVLICPCGHGALGVWAARQGQLGQLALWDTNIVAVTMARRTLAANGYPDVPVEIGLPRRTGDYDVVLMTLPKGRDLARLLFLYAFQALRVDGRLYLAGSNDEGIKSAIKDCEVLFGPSVVLAYKGGNRGVVFRRVPGEELPESYRQPGLAEGTYHTFEVALGDARYQVCSRPGVFAWRGLDVGTKLLLETLPIHATENALDLGCGYGILGMMMARRAPKGEVTLVDVDWLAWDCARASLARNGLQAEVVLGDGLAAVQRRRFSLIASNPPFHSGHVVSPERVEVFIAEAYAALQPRGRLVLVANRFLPYPQWMRQVFGSLITLAQTPQYHVLSAEKLYQRKARGKGRVDFG